VGGFLLGKYIVDRRASGAAALLLGLVSGAIAGLGIAPLLYPIFTGIGFGPAIPEYREMIIYFLTIDFPMFSEVYYIFGRAAILVFFIMTTLGVVGSAMGYAEGRKKTLQITDWTQ
jgi:hypothetical protein